MRPRAATVRCSKGGNVIRVDLASVPPDINSLLDATNRGIQVTSHGNLKTVIGEGNAAVCGLGPWLARVVKGTTSLAIDVRNNSDSLITWTDQSQPVLDSQTNTSDYIVTSVANIATVTGGLKTQDLEVSKLLNDQPGAADGTRGVHDRLQPSLPVLLRHLVSLGGVGATHNNDLEQLPVLLLTQGVSILQDAALANRNINEAAKGGDLPFNFNLNSPPACLTGFPAAAATAGSHRRALSAAPCRQLALPGAADSPFNVRGARNIPCEPNSGKRGPTAGVCEPTKSTGRSTTATTRWGPRPELRWSTHSATPPQERRLQPRKPRCHRRSRYPSTTRTPAPTSDPTAISAQTDLAHGANQRQSRQDTLLPPKGTVTPC